MRRTKETISKKVTDPIRSDGKSVSLPKLFSVGLISLLSAIPLASIPNRGITAYAQQQAQALDP